MGSTERTEVLVVGAGPVGMFAALCLSERGLQVRIVDKYARTALHSYALALHPHSLRLLGEMGAVEPLLDRGQRLERVAIHHNRGTPTEIDLTRVGGAHPYALALPQRVLEAALERRLTDNGVQVEWNQQVLTFETCAEGVRALLTRTPVDDGPEDAPPPIPETRRIAATFLIGADGYHSMTRRLMEFELETVGEPIHLGLIEFETPMEAPECMRLVFGGATTDALWPLGPDRGRWSVQVGDPSEFEDLAQIKQLVQARAPWYGDAFGSVEWVEQVHFERRLARRFGRGPVWLVGDAARFTSPIGVQSMNVGLHEAHDLARRIAGILREGRDPHLLDYYHEERLREWKMLLCLKDRIRVEGNPPKWIERMAERFVESLPASGQDLNCLLEQVGLRLYWLRRKGG